MCAGARIAEVMWIREAFKFEDWDVAKGSCRRSEINLSRFGISVNGLQERQQPFRSIYVPRRQPHLSAWEAFSQAAFPIPAKGLLF